MDGLPTASDAGNNQINAVIPIQSGTVSGQSNQSGNISAGKEIETGGVGFEEPGLKDVTGKEMELPREVAAAGVTSQPTTVQLPQPVAQMGVKPIGDAVVPVAPSVALPLTDDQIASGLKQSVTSSWRWLAEFCVRKLKQLHKSLTKQQIDKVTN